MDDYELALQLQFELNQTENQISNSAKEKQHKHEVPSKTSLVDESWELLDPNPDARALFLEFNEIYFWGKLAGVEVRWSPRMTTCAGLCCYEGRGGLCSIRLSKPLLTLRPRKDLVETLLHEMIHAYLFVTQNNKDHDGHGPEFHKHMYRINNDAGTNISVYHNFHDEVAHFKQHWWKCDGPCQHQPPYYGMVKRASNRAPSANDFWWERHRASCGGTYQKVKEPEGYGQKKAKKPKEEKPEKPKGCQDIRSVFGGKGNSLTTTSSNQKKPISPSRPKKPALPDLPQLDHESHNSTSVISPPRESFPGSGVTLQNSGLSSMGANSQNSQTRPGGPIVRRLPGIGVITNARPMISQSTSSSTSSSQNASHASQQNGDSQESSMQEPASQVKEQTEEDNSDDDIILYSPDAERESFRVNTDKSSSVASVSKSGASNGPVKASTPSESLFSKSNKETSSLTNMVPQRKSGNSRKRRSIVMPFDSDSDKEFDTLLSNIKKSKSTSSKNVGKKTSRIGKKTHDSRKLKAQKSKSLSSLRDASSTRVGTCQKITDFISVSNPNSPRVLKERSTNERIDSSPEYTREDRVLNFTMNRNKRAHNLISSDSDEDSDQWLTNRKRKKRDDWLRAEVANGTTLKKNRPTATISKPPDNSDDDSNISSNSVQEFDPDWKLNESQDAAEQNERDDLGAAASVAEGTSGTAFDREDVALVSCPVCQIKVPATSVNEHLDACLGMG